MTYGRRARKRSRPERKHDALVAAGVVLPTYELTQGGPVDLFFAERAQEAGFRSYGFDGWPCDAALQNVDEALIHDNDAAVFRLADGTLALVSCSWGRCHVRVAAADAAGVAAAMTAFRTAYPPMYLIRDPGDSEMRVPITFWTLGPYGPVPRMRLITAQAWADIEGNYPADVRDQLAALMHDFQPGKTGQLVLWQGPPGTGKSWALRALASEWSAWAEFHYITDPDSFFVDNPIYMIDVLLSDSYTAIEPESGDLVEEADPEGKWRVLILEDTGELLAADAKEKYGQGLSRLLNVVDGMIGQGLRVLVLVTTNDELGELNPAVRRPGRCASQIEFRGLTPEEAAEWLGEQVDDGASLAELYARRGAGTDALPDDDDSATVAEVRVVAEAHAPDGGYGDTWWRAADRTVFWNAADWTTNDEADAARAAFLAIDGVDAFDSDAEVGDMSGDGYECVWPVPDSEAVNASVNAPEPDDAASLDELLRLAAMPLGGAETAAGAPEAVAASLASLARAGRQGGLDEAGVRLALETLAAAHRTTAEAVAAVLAAGVRERGGDRGDSLALATLAVLSQFAQRPQPAAAPITVNVPERTTTVNVGAAEHHIDVRVPEQPPAVVNVAAQPAPIIHVDLPDPVPAQVEVNVHPAEPLVPEPPAAPVLHLHVPDRPRPRAVRVEYDGAGNKRFVVEEEDE